MMTYLVKWRYRTIGFIPNIDEDNVTICLSDKQTSATAPTKSKFTELEKDLQALTDQDIATFDISDSEIKIEFSALHYGTHFTSLILTNKDAWFNQQVI